MTLSFCFVTFCSVSEDGDMDDPCYDAPVTEAFANHIFTDIGKWKVVAWKLNFTPAEVDEVSYGRMLLPLLVLLPVDDP